MQHLSHLKCIICGSTKLVSMPKYAKHYLNQCFHCSFVFSNQIPTHDELITHYEKYPRTNSISAITIKRYNELLDKFEVYRQTNNILDIGCGDGFFLEEAKKRNWNVYGTEYTDIAVTICNTKGINTQQGKLDSANYNASFFDIITSFEVIEHINNPIEDITHCNTILRKGGGIYFTTPNFNSLSRLYLKNTWNVIEYPEHLSYYTKNTLKRLLNQNNFKTVSFESTGISISRIIKSKYAGESTSSNVINTSFNDEFIREKTETKWIYKMAKKIINSTLTLFNVGDTLKGFFIKK